MSISRRAAKSARILGVASAAAALTLGLANSALACNIRDFSAAASCDDHGKGIISVTDKDASGTPATVTLYAKMSSASSEEDRLIGTQTIDHPTGQGVTIDFAWDWAPEAQYRVHIKATNRVDEDISPNVTAPSKACEAASTPAPSGTPSAVPSASAPAKPTSSASPSAAAPAGANTPSPAVGGKDLAETGSSSSTGLIAGVAGTLVVVGGAAVFLGMRRRNTAQHS